MTDNGNNMEHKTIEAALAARAQQSSAMPWLEMKVMNQVEWREQAKVWLKTHPGGLTRKPPQPLRIRLWSAICSLVSARSWHMVGIALAVAGLVYLFTLIPSTAPAVQSLGRWGGITTLAAVLMVLAIALVNWPRLRHFYG